MTAKRTARVRLGVAGAGRGKSFAEVARHVEGAELVAICDPSEGARTRFSETYGVQAVPNFEELLDSGVDAVILSSPQQYHAPQAVMALERGVHVMSEVPAVVTLEQAQALVGAVRHSDALYMMAENYCWMAPNLIIREMVREGMFGDIYFGEGEYLHELSALQHDANGDRTWRYYWQVGRNACGYPTHSLGPLLWWFDSRVTSIACNGTGRWTDPQYEMEDSVTMSCRTREGALLEIRLDFISRRPSIYYYSLQGTQGAYESSRVRGDGVVYLHGKSPDNEWQSMSDFAHLLPDRYRDTKGTGHGGSDLFPITEFVEAILLGKPSPIDVYRSLDMTLPGIISEQSLAEGGRWVHVPDPRFFGDGIGANSGKEWPLA